jgi:DNA helicase IV
VWPKLAPEQVLFRLLSDADFLASSAHGVLTADEQAALLWSKRPRSWKSARWSDADLVLLDELADLMERRPGSLGHLVVDEAQDLSPMQLRALHRRCRSGSMTVLGDLAQATTPWSTGSWDQVLEHLGVPDARLVELDRGFRVPAQIIEVAARLLPAIAPGLRPPTGIRAVPDAYQVVETSDRELLDQVVATCRAALAREGSIGVIAADSDIAAVHERLAAAGHEPAMLGVTEDAMESARLVCVPATLAKGLEFDTVVVVEPSRIVEAEPRGLHRLYVVLTRAVTRLVLVHAQPLPAPMQDAA